MLTERECLAALPPKGFLSSYVRSYAMGRTDAHVAYHIGCGLAALSQIAPPTVVFRFGGMRVKPNLFVLLVGSSASRKGAAIDLVQEVMEENNLNFMERPGSKEALILDLIENPKQLLVYPEFAAFLSAAESGPLLSLKTTLNDAYDCLDSRTEILTPGGWKQRGEISVGDLVYSLNRDTGSIESSPVLALTDREVRDGERMLEFKSLRYNIRVTEGHDFHVKYGDPSDHGKPSKNFLTTKARDLVERRGLFYVPTSGEYDFPGVPLSDDELRLIAWFLTDGMLNRTRLSISQSKPITRDRIRDLLTRLKIDFTETIRAADRKGAFPNAQPLTTFGIPQGAHNGSMKRTGWDHLAPYLVKDVSPLLHAMTAKQFDVFWEELLLGDGSNASSKRQTPILHCNLKAQADAYSHMAVVRGYTSTIGTYTTPNNHVMYWVNARKRKFIQTQFSDPRTQKPNLVLAIPGERVWCVTNKNSTIITRREGKIVILGNCVQLGHGTAGTKRAKKRMSVKQPRLSLLAGCAPNYLSRHSESVDWTDGFFARFFCIDAERERFFDNPLDDPEARARSIAKLASLKEEAESIGDSNECRGFDDAAADMWGKWAQSIEKNRQKARFPAMVIRATAFAQKIAVLLACDYGNALCHTAWRVTRAELEPAIALAELHVKSAMSIAESIGENPDMRDRHAVLRMIGAKPTPMSVIIGGARLLSWRVKRILESLQEEGVIRSISGVGNKQQHFIRVMSVEEEINSLASQPRAGRAPIQEMDRARTAARQDRAESRKTRSGPRLSFGPASE